MKPDYRSSQWEATFQLCTSVAKQDKTSASCQNLSLKRQKIWRLFMMGLLKEPFLKPTKTQKDWMQWQWSSKRVFWSQALSWFWDQHTRRLNSSRMTEEIHSKWAFPAMLLKLSVFRLFPKQAKSFIKWRTKRKSSLFWTRRKKSKLKMLRFKQEARTKIKSVQQKSKFIEGRREPFVGVLVKNGSVTTNKLRTNFFNK